MLEAFLVSLRYSEQMLVGGLFDGTRMWRGSQESYICLLCAGGRLVLTNLGRQKSRVVVMGSLEAIKACFRGQEFCLVLVRSSIAIQQLSREARSGVYHQSTYPYIHHFAPLCTTLAASRQFISQLTFTMLSCNMFKFWIAYKIFVIGEVGVNGSHQGTVSLKKDL